VKRLPVVQSTSFSGISCLARSTKFWPLQCIGRTVLELEFLQLGHHLAQIIVGRRSQVETADRSTE
jgi:hypothetical protein